MNILKKLFNKKLKVLDNQKTFIKKNIGNIKTFDDVKIKIEDDLFDGWVYGNKSNIIYVVYTDKDNALQYAEFEIIRPLDRTELTQNNKTLIL